MKANCTICGREDDADWMMPIITGGKKQYQCHKCRLLGQKEAAALVAKRKMAYKTIKADEE